LGRLEPDGTIEHERIQPDAALAPYLAHFWWVRWDLDRPFIAQTLPHPTVHIVFDHSKPADRWGEVSGVSTTRFSRQLCGQGRVFGIKFRPATFAALLGMPMTTLTDRVVSIGEVFGNDGTALGRDIVGASDLRRCIAAAEAFLAPRLPPLPEGVAQIRDIVEHMETQRSILRAEHAAKLHGIDLRTLQRRFRKFLGVSPKWVVQRYRLHEAAARLQSITPPSLAMLAAELGYSDQSHFSRDFAVVVGRPPGSFSRET
jgi:AraC-like DNA-binding protein